MSLSDHNKGDLGGSLLKLVSTYTSTGRRSRAPHKDGCVCAVCITNRAYIERGGTPLIRTRKRSTRPRAETDREYGLRVRYHNNDENIGDTIYRTKSISLPLIKSRDETGRFVLWQKPKQDSMPFEKTSFDPEAARARAGGSI